MANVPLGLARGEEAVYHSALADGRLLYQRCADCAAVIWYPRTVCPNCAGGRLEWRESARIGTVYSLTTLHRSGHPARVGDVPYTVALVDLDEGFRVLGNLAGEFEIGCRVRASIVTDDAASTLLFDTVEDAS